MDREPHDDSLLMKRFAQGDSEALSILYSRYKKSLYSYFIHMTHDKSKSEDLLQNTFLRIAKYGRSYRHRGSFKAWLFAIARNEWVEQHRHRKKEESYPADFTTRVIASDDPHSELVSSDRKQRLMDALAQIDEDKREAIVLVKLRELKYREVAELLSEKESNIKIKVFRGMNQLRQILTPTT